MEKLNILITSVGSTTSIGVIKFIKKSNVNAYVIGTDINEGNRIAGSAFCHKFYRSPFFYDPNYVSVFKDLIIKEKIQIVIPIHDQEIEIFSKNKNEFECIGCRIIVSDQETISKVNNKYLFARTLHKAGVLTPETYTPKDWFLKARNGKEDKWLLKPVNGVSSRGITIANSVELAKIIKAKQINDGYIVQEFIEGIEYTVDVFVKNKIPYCIVPRIREEVRDGLCYKASTVKNGEFIQPVQQIASLFNFFGPINIQFIKCKTSGKIYCIECNPRFGGSSIISLHAGVNLFDIIVKDYLGKEILLYDSYREICMTRYWEEVFYEK